MDHLTDCDCDRLTPRRMLVYPRRYRHRLQNRWPWEEEEETNLTTSKAAEDLLTKRILFPQPEISVPANDLYTMKIPLGKELEPEDVNVDINAKNHTVIIHAKKEKRSEDGSIRVYKEVTRKLLLPTTVDLKDAKSFLTTDGAVKVEAPLQQIPIKISKSFFELLPDWKTLGDNLLLSLVFATAVLVMYRFVLFMSRHYHSFV
jgi:hypothetical protein